MTLQILSTGAPKGGVSACAEAFEKKTGETVAVTFVTAPVLRDKVEAGEADADVIVAPVARMDEFEAEGRVLPGLRTVVGSVKAGVVVWDGAPDPDISSADALKATLLAADSVVYNVATSGAYIVRMIERLGISGDIEDRVVRVPNGAGVMMHLAESKNPKEIGFGQLTEIRIHENRGVPVRLVGALPQELENVTTYCAAVFGKAGKPDAAKALVEFMGTDDGRRLCIASGLEF